MFVRGASLSDFLLGVLVVACPKEKGTQWEGFLNLMLVFKADKHK